MRKMLQTTTTELKICNYKTLSVLVLREAASGYEI